MKKRSNGAWAARAARARELIEGTSPAADLLGFYAALVEYQQRLAGEGYVGRVLSDPPDGAASAGSLLGAVDAAWVGRAVRDLVAWLPAVAPQGLRASAEAMCDVAVEEWRELFETYRASPDEAAARFSDAAVFALEAVLQPVAERLAAGRPNGPAVSTAESARAPSTTGAPTSPRDVGWRGGGTTTRCPVCGGAPVVGVLREEGHGARRRLVCGLCFTEWDYLRLVCVRCGEQRFEALPVFSAEQFPHARVEACDTCRSYLKTIDATRDARVVPVVDDLATIALDLWAREQGYARVRTNLARI